ncbi:HNH endonuclease signature motif containing protein [Tessaracoccus sp. ZS01]|uniref:HNH endonuclease signature motif containing protein n=1 Tax=Tessaracoccus sp. ZS01 TaxID=1906324 RepID=UPI00096E30EC|nr:HNH endonuclease signature motif containing protein [Tessaracoccus sp. ZS01]MCG6567543.1 HNH endonuclease [Tessaracoccus sp. ZS01]OMG55907.1 hypothetical protein BJN44_07910 [Tessaracoccus sp. ZS01]
MSEARELMQQGIAALWDAAGSLLTDSPAAERLATMVHTVTEAEAQLAGLRLHLLHEARLSAADGVVEEVRQSVRTTTAQATASLKLAMDLGERFPLIASALNDGELSLAQAEAIISGLRKLPNAVTRAELVKCQESVLAKVHNLGPDELRELASHVFRVIDPDGAEAEDKKRLDAQDRAAHRSRFLIITPDHHGSSRFSGKLPTAQVELLAAQLDAVTPPASSYRDSDEPSDPAVRRADALMILVHTAAATGKLPAHGGDRPQVHITVNYDTLLTGLGRVDVLGGHGPGGLSAADARHLACDADLIPVVLGTDSQPLDVGRKHRLFPAGIRTALTLRDGGCAFPGCTARPASCEAHHIVPWWAGGTSCLGNAVLLCPHHHRLVEPDPQQSSESQWQVHLDPDTGKPWFTPPRHIDPARRPRQHRRHLLHELVTSTKAPPCPDEPEPPDFNRLEELIARTAAVWQSAAH